MLREEEENGEGCGAPQAQRHTRQQYDHQYHDLEPQLRFVRGLGFKCRGERGDLSRCRLLRGVVCSLFDGEVCGGVAGVRKKKKKKRKNKKKEEEEEEEEQQQHLWLCCWRTHPPPPADNARFEAKTQLT